MKRFLTVALMGVLALGLGSTAYANLCSTDVVPAATLLFPFVQLDYDNPNGGDTTLFAITNVSSEAQIVHITIWTDYSVAILDFNVILTGYDVSTMSIRDILVDGILPGPLNGQTIWTDDNAGGVFDYGPVSEANELANYDFGANNLPMPEDTETYLDCDPAVWDSSPNNYTYEIPQDFLNTLEGYLKASQTASKWYEDCAGDEVEIVNNLTGEESWFIMRDSGPVWMYITADVVDTCNKLLPDSDATYWDTVQPDNVIIGDVIWFNSEANTSETSNAVHLEAADFSYGQTLTDDELPTTFYYRYNMGVPYDGREPLPTAWAFRYGLNPANNVNTKVRAFKGGTNYSIVQDLNDGAIGGPGPASLYASACIPYTMYAWDENEMVNSYNPDEDPWSGGEEDLSPVPNLLPLETQEVDVSQFNIVYDESGDWAFGWMLFVWPRSNTDALVQGANPPYDQYQTWMGTKLYAFGQYTAGKDGAVMANYNCDSRQILPQLGIGALFAVPH
jgi:hypothetical protein